MKSSIFLAVAGAVLAMAKPVRHVHDKRAMETKWVTDVVTKYVTAGDEPTAAVYKAPPKPTYVAPPPPPKPTYVAPPPPPKPTYVAPPPPPKPTYAPPPPPPAPKPTYAPPPPPSKPDSGLGGYEGKMIDHHNVHRRNHSSPDLEWDSTLAGYAANTANTCVFAHDMSQGGGGYGQNLASWGSSGDISSLQIESGIKGVTDQWYNGEMPNWQFYGSDNPPSYAPLDDWGHFTQVVWKSSTKCGCATVFCKAGTIFSGMDTWYTVCNYDPPGNYGGEYASNVLKPLGMASETV